MILIIDNGSQYTHLIKRNCRDLGFDSETISNKKKLSEVKNLVKNAEKIILSGGPSSVYASNNGLGEEIIRKIAFGHQQSAMGPRLKAEGSRQPILGICFGHQLIAHLLGGRVEKGTSAEYGLTKIYVDEADVLFAGLPKEFNAWASHYDEVNALPKDFVALAHSNICKIEAMKHKTLPIFSVQFHPEVWHTENGEKILENFLKVE